MIEKAGEIKIKKIIIKEKYYINNYTIKFNNFT